jgi:hypothetical protein
MFDPTRRDFLMAGTAAITYETLKPASARAIQAGRIKFGVIGLNHGHIYGQTRAVIRGGGELVSFYAKEPELVAAFQKEFPQARLARSEVGDPRGQGAAIDRQCLDPQ